MSHEIATIPTYTPKEADRLAVFKNIIRHTAETQSRINTHDTPITYGKITDKEVIVERYFTMDGKFAYIWNHVAQNLFDEFSKKPHMVQAALDIRDEVRLLHNPCPKTLNGKELTTIFEREE